MFLVASTPFGGLIALFCAVPLALIASIYGAEYTTALRHRPRRPKRP